MKKTLITLFIAIVTSVTIYAQTYTGRVLDPGFEQVRVGDGKYQYRPTGSPWIFAGNSGITSNNSGFTWGNPPAPQGTQVAFLQKVGGFYQFINNWSPGFYR